jgi:hypothetical protein
MQGNQRQGLHALSYIGGLIDGEGSIMITRSTSGRGRKTPSYTPRIKIAMTDPESVQFIVAQTGYGKINREVDRRDGGIRKVIYLWQIHSLTQCREFAEMILPYLIIKAPQARLMIQYCSSFTVQRKCMDGVPIDERSYREEVYENMHKLNMRNRPQRLSPEAPRGDATV